MEHVFVPEGFFQVKLDHCVGVCGEECLWVVGSRWPEPFPWFDVDGGDG